MDTQRRVALYESQGRLTPAKRRRLVKKAGRDPRALVAREGGMGYPPAHQDYRVLTGFERAALPE